MTTIHFVHQVGPLPACMGGFCNQRESCARYWQRDSRTPAERLCERGAATQWRPLDIPRSDVRLPAAMLAHQRTKNHPGSGLAVASQG